MHTFHFLIVCCYAINIAMCVVLRDFSPTRNTIPEASTDSLKVKCSKLGSNVEIQDKDSEINIDKQGSSNFQLENESSLDRFTIPDDSVKVPDELMVHSFAQSGLEQRDFENDDDALLETISDLLPTAGFEFLIASETLKKATVLEELASSITPFEGIPDEDDFNAFLIEDNDCEEIQTFQLKDSETKNDSLISIENESFELLSAEANQSLHATEFFLLISDSSMESFQDNSTFENTNLGISIKNVASSEIKTPNVDTDFVLLIPGGSTEDFRENSSMFKDVNEDRIDSLFVNVTSSEIETTNSELEGNFRENSSIFKDVNVVGIDSLFVNVTSSEIETTNSELEGNLPTIQDVLLAPLKVPEITAGIMENLTEKTPDTSNEVLLVEMSDLIETTRINLTSSEMLVTDSNVSIFDTLVTDSNVTVSEEKKCPPGGFCLFSFVFRDTCTKHSDCRGNRLCCKSGCSKKCLDL